MAADLDVCRAFIDAHPDDAARMLERLAAADAAALLDALPAASTAGVFDRMVPAAAVDILVRMQPAAAAAMLVELRSDRGAALLRRLDAGERTALLDALPGHERDAIASVLRYQEGTAGAVMDPRVLAVPDDITVGEALGRVRRAPRHKVSFVYVVDREQRLAGVVHIREAMMARPGEPITSRMQPSVARVSATTSRAGILAHPGWREFYALPVVDERGVLLGVIRYQTFRQLDEEARATTRGTDAGAAVFALGELYWLGLSGLIDGLASVVKRSQTEAPVILEGDRGPR